jgi:hypothetical protein
MTGMKLDSKAKREYAKDRARAWPTVSSSASALRRSEEGRLVCHLERLETHNGPKIHCAPKPVQNCRYEPWCFELTLENEASCNDRVVSIRGSN